MGRNISSFIGMDDPLPGEVLSGQSPEPARVAPKARGIEGPVPPQENYHCLCVHSSKTRPERVHRDLRERGCRPRKTSVYLFPACPPDCSTVVALMLFVRSQGWSPVLNMQHPLHQLMSGRSSRTKVPHATIARTEEGSKEDGTHLVNGFGGHVSVRSHIHLGIAYVT